MTQPSTRAQPPLEFIPPAFNPLVWHGCRGLLPLWLHWRASLSEIQGDGVERLADFYRQFQAGKIRFLMAFRHPSLRDPLCLAYLLWQLVPEAARRQGISLTSPLHAHFIYDRGIPLWAGPGVGWLASRLGGTPIQRGTLDVAGLRSARDLFANSPLPMAAAPEGATNGHNEIVSPLEPGISQLGFWCVGDLQKASRSQEVFLVPIGIQYRYLTPPWAAIEGLLSQLEAESGLEAGSQTGRKEALDEAALYQRLHHLGEHLLSLMENFYQTFYPQTWPQEMAGGKDRGTLAARLQNLLHVALQVAEGYFHIQPNGNAIDRCRRVEQAGWDCIYRQDLKSPDSLSGVERGLADRIAEEASLRMWHMRLVETFVAVTGHYVREKPTAERFAETVLLLWDFVSRLKGTQGGGRPQLGRQQVRMTVGQPLSVSQRWGAYQANRRQAVADLTRELQTALEGTIY